MLDGCGSAPIGSIYHFFPGGKDDLVVECLESSGASYLELFELIAAEFASPADAVTAFFDGGADVLAATDYLDLCPIATVAHETASNHDRIRAAADAVFASWIDAFARRLVGDGLSEQVARELAVTVVAMLEGAIILARTGRDGETMRTVGRASHRLIERALHDAVAARDARRPPSWGASHDR